MASDHPGIGNRIAPPRFVMFCLVALVAVPVAIALGGWSVGTMIGFDIAAAAFLASAWPLLRDSDAESMRKASKRNDGNRVMLLVISAMTTLAVLAAVAGELTGSGNPDAPMIALVMTTLVLSWTFGNMVYAMHYAHLYYLAGDDGKDGRGLDFPDTDEPGYWDFLYFAFTLGMTFQTSDTGIETTQLRKVALGHSMVAFVFNLGVIAFTINVLGSG
ncbi:DUF1345 domain-containing protein [Sphingomonas sp.]|uniref:DUF1345 domain-containing protein n=1 Tax=Sphingomonas sp. TaxID=28214 RepID=UPI002C63DFC1|nr:DUF1345 domain-containing protein [Sphingomonas sp.]HWK36866.1 DUF1345 domain-containing protein [Sphingomonas sp.]